MITMATRKDLLLLAVHLVALIAFVDGNGADCSSYRRCSECITADPNCVWCNDPATFSRLANSSTDLMAAPLCYSRGDSSFTCGTSVDPGGEVNIGDTDDPIVSPSSAVVNLRPGAPASFEVTVTPAESVPLDMYVLMDLTFTMLDDLAQLRQFAPELVATMQNLTSDFRIAFGSFIDKTTSPFTAVVDRDFPCAEEADAEGITQEQCDVAYAYRHSLDFTADPSLFQAMVNSSTVSASTDSPESTLEAMLQAAVCEERLGWREQGTSRRLILTITDGDFHYANDGKIGGVTTPAVETCLLDDNGEYTSDTIYDYPSVQQLADALSRQRIIPIVAATASQRPVYERMRETVRNIFVGTLSANSDNLLTLLREQYQLLSTTVIPIVTGLDPSIPLEVAVEPVDSCSPGQLRPDSSDVCIDISASTTVAYTVTVTPSRDICDALSGSNVTVRIQFIGFGLVEVTLRPICDCDCSGDSVPNSAECSGAGTLECSTCVCPEGLAGARCECNSTTNSMASCSPSPLDEPCSGNGRCECGECTCFPVAENSSTLFEGQFCQFDPTNCPTSRSLETGEFLPCGGRGRCEDGRCECDVGFSGLACECPEDTRGCIGPLDNTTTMCSGVGDCVCNVCVCFNYTERLGRQCEMCGPCQQACSVLEPCIRCMLLDDEPCDCEERVTVVDSVGDVPGSNNTDLRNCSLVESGCEVRYRINPLVQGTEDGLFVFIDTSQTGYVTVTTNPSDCSSDQPIWPIPVGIILGIIIVGIILIALWRGLTYLGEYLEYQQWQKSVQEETSKRGSNPLFVDPNAKYQNPRYRVQSHS